MAGDAFAAPSRWWSELTTKDFSRLAMDGFVAVLPVSAIEQHGPHLPVSVDADIGAGIVGRTVALLDPDQHVLVLPALVVGKSDEHTLYPGTLTTSHETLARLWFDVAASVRRTGCRRLLFANSHGGQRALVDIVCRDIRVRLGMLAVNAAWFSMVDSGDLFGAAEAVHGIHGGAAETSLMLHLHGDRVRPDEIADFAPETIAWEGAGARLTAEGAVGFGWQTQDLQVSGACGDARLATETAGRDLLERSARAMVGLLREIEAFPLARLERSPSYRTREGSAEMRVA